MKNNVPKVLSKKQRIELLQKAHKLSMDACKKSNKACGWIAMVMSYESERRD